MRKSALWLVALLLLVTPVRSEDRKDGKLLSELWESVYIGGAKAGYVHTRTVETGTGDRRVWHTELVLDLTLRRGPDTVRQHMVETNDETPDGKVTAVSMSQLLAKNQEMLLTGTVEGNQLHTRAEGAYQFDRRVRWNPEVIGLYRQQLLLKERKVKPGDKFSFLSYEPQVNSVLRVSVTVGDNEMVETSPRGKKQRLLRVEAVPDKIQVGASKIQLPSLVRWVDKDYEEVRSEVDMPGLGMLMCYRDTQKVATQPGGQGTLPSIQQTIRLNRRIPNAHDTRLVVYRITLKGNDDPRDAFARDERQEVKNVNGRTFDVYVRGVDRPQATEHPGEVGGEFLKSCYFINCDDVRVKALAKQAVGRETDPWQKALRIERWVHDNMRITNLTEAMATADHVARTLEGDCTEFAMLAAAMCRAVGVPSRTAIGLVYFEDRSGRPGMGFHMWTEVWVNGQWLGIDATLGRRHVGAAHLKVTDHSWHDTQSLTPLLPLIRVLGKISIEVVRYEGAE